MEFFRFRRDIPFMRHALVFNVISLVTVLAAVFFLAIRGLNFGVDFGQCPATLLLAGQHCSSGCGRELSIRPQVQLPFRRLRRLGRPP